MDPMEPSEPSEVVRALWNRIQDRDWIGVGERVAEHGVIEWPASRERIAGRDNFVAVNREYPEGWSIHVLRIVADDDQVVSEVEVPHTGLGIFRVASFWTVIDNRIVRGTEYWRTVGADEAPQWRARHVARYRPPRFPDHPSRAAPARRGKAAPATRAGPPGGVVLPRRLVGDGAGHGELGRPLGQHEPVGLELADRPSEGLPLLAVLERLLEPRLSCGQGRRSDRRPLARQVLHQRDEP